MGLCIVTFLFSLMHDRTSIFFKINGMYRNSSVLGQFVNIQVNFWGNAAGSKEASHLRKQKLSSKFQCCQSDTSFPPLVWQHQPELVNHRLEFNQLQRLTVMVDSTLSPTHDLSASINFSGLKNVLIECYSSTPWRAQMKIKFTIKCTSSIPTPIAPEL